MFFLRFVECDEKERKYDGGKRQRKVFQSLGKFISFVMGFAQVFLKVVMFIRFAKLQTSFERNFHKFM